jgi:hypothetical protein
MCRFLQVWLTPDKRGHTPQYGSSQYVKADRHNRLLHILGGTEEAPAWDNVNAGKDCIKLHQVCARPPARPPAGLQQQRAARTRPPTSMRGNAVLAVVASKSRSALQPPLLIPPPAGRQRVCL